MTQRRDAENHVATCPISGDTIGHAPETEAAAWIWQCCNTWRSAVDSELCKLNHMFRVEDTCEVTPIVQARLNAAA